MPQTQSQLKNWQKVRLGDVANVLPGFAFKSSEFKKNGDIPVIKIKNIINDLNVSTENGEYLDESALNEKTKKYLISNGDILVAMTGATAGKVGKFRSNKKALLNQRVAKIIPKNIDANFLWVLLGNKDTINLLYRLADGVAQPNMSGGQIENIEFKIPTRIEDQKSIADVLSTYDDLIYNNTRRIQILEQMAQVIYRESFVTPIANDPLPKGWEVSTLGEHLAELESGSRPKGGVGELKTGIPSVGAENINGIGRHDHASEKFIEKNFFERMTRGVVKDRDVALYKDGAYIGRSSYFRDGFPHKIFSVNEHVFLLRSSGERITQNFLYLWLREPLTIHAIRATNANAAQPGVNQSGIRGIKITLAPKEMVKVFDNKVEPILAFIINLAKQNNELRKMRDLLLPKLTTGEIQI